MSFSRSGLEGHQLFENNLKLVTVFYIWNYEFERQLFAVCVFSRFYFQISIMSVKIRTFGKNRLRLFSRRVAFCDV